jgi:3-phosphoshikimate 1-carboxyvinyltransferase
VWDTGVRDDAGAMPDPNLARAALKDPYPIAPLHGRLDASVRVPGSKSITNRVLPVAALASGTSVLHGVGAGDDVDAMLGALRALGVVIVLDEQRTATVTGTAGVLPCDDREPGPVTIDVRQSGTTARFLTAILAFGQRPVRIDADPQMRSRPMGLLVDVLRDLGVAVVSDGEDGTLPYLVTPAARPAGTAVSLPGSITSQFTSGLLLSAPLHGAAGGGGLHITLEPPVVSRPYLDMTAAVMGAFGVPVESAAASFTVRGGHGYRATEHRIEPDASGASYFFAAAAIAGGSVAVPGLGAASLQGDLTFVRLLEQMGADVTIGSDTTTVVGTGTLHGIDVDMADVSDTVPTLAVVAAFADSPTRIRGVGFIRHKESDRIGNVVRELRRAGVHAEEHDDGMTIDPTRSAVRAATIETYDDHRMAMAFALLGLRLPGIGIADPTCVNKTYPGYWHDLAALDRRP